jgi:acyl-CoA synthetase (AMP-forming)/AMP-acid ligase II
MILHSPTPSIAIPDTPLVPYVLRRAADLPDKVALVCSVTGHSYTYAELADGIAQVAAGLHARGVRKGDVVGLVSSNTPDFALVFFGVVQLGAICSTVNPIATAEEIGAQFADSEAVCIVTINAMAEKCADAARHASSVREIFAIGACNVPGVLPFSELLSHGNAPPVVHIDPAHDVAALPYSSGTSGIPKGVMLTHRNLVANLAQMVAGDVTHETDVAVAVLPFFHIYGMVVVMSGALAQGATVVCMPRFDLAGFLQLIQDHKVSLANVVPPIILALAKHPAVDDYDVSSLRLLFSGAAPLGAELAKTCAERLDVKVVQGYGLTETSPVTHYHPLDADVPRYASIGPPICNTECRVVDPDSGEDVAQGERGELWIRGPQVMKGYFKKPDATALCMTTDGWFKTGDVAVVDELGWFSIVDRVKELIKYKGMQVAPAELEALLLSHPNIADAAVIPLPDDDAGEIPKAFIVARGALDADAVMAFVAERVSPYKRVRRVEFVESIPKSASGKILRRLLVEWERAARDASVRRDTIIAKPALAPAAPRPGSRA